VARLVATGKTNREVAGELYVTVKTVEFHLHGVFAKLGIGSRHQIAERLGSGARTVSSLAAHDLR
jgi:DNA-binding CsgD family transcriptional regulator